MKFLFLFLFLVSCGGGGGGGEDATTDATVTPSKAFFSSWVGTDLSLNMTGFEFANPISITLTNTTLLQIWIDELNTRGRDTTGLVAGAKFDCGYTFTIEGTEDSGVFIIDHNDADTPANNACTQWDTDCTQGVCNFSTDHAYTRTDNVLTIDYFGDADSGTYGSSILR